MTIPIPVRRATLQERIEIAVKHSLRHVGIDIRRLREPGESETSLARPRLAEYCQGYGVDLGFGGDPITPSAIRVDLPQPYTEVGKLPVQLGGDAADLYWFKDGCLDYVYSSHLLEDFEDTGKVLREWIRVLKIGGKLIIYCPDEQRYRAFCARENIGYNTHHVHEDFSLKKVKDIILGIGNCKVVHEGDNIGAYCWEIAVEKVR